MNLLLVHNHYHQHGGEDEIFASEARLLHQYGHKVVEYEDHNHRINEMNQFSIVLQAIWSRSSKRKLLGELRDAQPDIVHFHNTFVLISPSAYYACKELGIPVIQTLHNYRLLCPTATFYRDGRVCEDCLGKTPPWPGVLHACYHGSRMHTAAVATMLTSHRLLNTWKKQVDVYITLTEFSKRKFIEGGIPQEKIFIKPNFVYPDPGMRECDRGYALFLGRLSPEKGINTLLKAWRYLGEIPLKVIGSGPLMKEVQGFVQIEKLKNIEILGQRPYEEVLGFVKGARFLVIPSECYENFPMVIAEAFACGVPVVASRLGAMAEIVEDGQTGLHFEPGNPEDLAAKVEWAWMHAREMKRMGCGARAEYETKYTAERNYKMLMDIYQMACERGGRG